MYSEPWIILGGGRANLISLAHTAIMIGAIIQTDWRKYTYIHLY